jgi:hypothetical protein
MIPRGSGEYQRISPPSSAMGNQPLLYADTSNSDGIMTALAENERCAPCKLQPKIASILYDGVFADKGETRTCHS